MKKLLAILGVLGISTSSVGAVVACENKKEKEDDKITSGDLSDPKVVSVTNIVVDRGFSKEELMNQDLVHDNKKVTEQAVVDGLNLSNNTAIALSDVEITFLNSDKILATVTAVEGSKFTGTVDVQLNKDVNIDDIIKVTNIGNVYIDKKVWNPEDVGQLIVNATMLMEFIGTKNPVLEQLADQIFKLTIAIFSGKNPIIISQDTITLDFSVVDEGVFLTSKVTINFKYNDDTRLTIKEAIKTTDLGQISNNEKDTILKKVYALNKENMPNISESVFIENAILNKDAEKPGTATIEFVAGTALFKGHDATALALLGMELEDIQVEVQFAV
ncbi:hypothetical protein SSABA_v1c04590 [Spiroplasma sabaudiense Ar-1343]|uniref:Lipoprotein n=1 Tax=Spiroplasma sabaudiense Ar-1343 TaxID=1276257 RepID=W6AA37_9MOLU|nr:lipoprotein [Spiroplasma sabaudiense]AHI53866.1 hypothetical protein SSABA_v1c04590 [Spiroplasma sabaudiense Ar-1343]